jgi:hypothetical protein
VSKFKLFDFTGHLIKEGDTVVACVAHGRNSGASLTKGIVTKLTEKTVFFEGGDYTGRYVRERKCSPNKCIIIEKGEESVSHKFPTHEFKIGVE